MVAQEATAVGGEELAFGEVIFIVFQFCCRHSLVSHLYSSVPFSFLSCDCGSDPTRFQKPTLTNQIIGRSAARREFTSQNHIGNV